MKRLCVVSVVCLLFFATTAAAQCNGKDCRLPLVKKTAAATKVVVKDTFTTAVSVAKAPLAAVRKVREAQPVRRVVSRLQEAKPVRKALAVVLRRGC